MTLDPECIFCKIIEGQIPAEIIYRNENVLAFNDLNPQAPTHVLIIPTLHAENAAAISLVSPTIIAAIHRAADEIALEKGLTGYRTVFNTLALVDSSWAILSEYWNINQLSIDYA